MRRILFVSNRLPYHLEKTENGYESKLSVSGLVSGVQSIFQENEGLWLGWAGSNQEVCHANADLIGEWEKENYYAIDIPTDILVNAHENFNNRSLWSLFHYFIDFVDFRREDWEAYKEYNFLFAQQIIKHFKRGDKVFINDFQLMLVPKLLKMVLGSEIDVTYFHHITFPTADIFERLPVAKELLEGVLGANYIGFHTEGHVRAFKESVKRTGLELGEGKVEANPIGIDPEFWDDTLSKPRIKATAHWMKSCFYKKKIILATERLDYTKGIKERISAYDYLLTKYPELRAEVMLVQIAVHSRTNVPVYQTIGREVDEAVGHLKGKYERLDWRPIYYSNRGFSQEELVALYSISEVACITPLVDGLNLVSKEYVVSGDDNRSLILSKFAGASDELTDAYIVNPYDVEEVGEAMYQALSTPNVGKLKKIVRKNTIYTWANKMLK